MPALETILCIVCDDVTSVDVVLDAGARGRVVRCRRCGLAFVSPRPVSTIDLYADPAYFDGATSDAGYLSYREDSEVMATYFEGVARELLVLSDGRRLLEVGCANGAFLRRARAVGFQVQGVEPNDRAASEGRAVGLPIVTGSVDDVVLDARAFDIVVLMQTLEHLPHPEATLARLFRLLRPGGLLLLTTPDQHSWLARISGKHWFEYKPPEHLFLFTPATITTFVSRAGFERIEVSADVHRYPPRWVLRRLARYVPATRRFVSLLERVLPSGLLDRTLPVPYGSMRVLARRPTTSAWTPAR